MTTQSTPAAQWREKGEADPFGKEYDCERAALTLGRLTDDELANAVFLHDHRTLDVEAILRGEPSSIALLTAAKERIRWLSRALEKALASGALADPLDKLTAEQERLGLYEDGEARDAARYRWLESRAKAAQDGQSWSLNMRFRLDGTTLAEAIDAAIAKEKP
jgi:hypothetical protein